MEYPPKCPVCDAEILFNYENFTDIEWRQGGKNIFCPNPSCHCLLWLPTRGEPPQTVPLNPYYIYRQRTQMNYRQYLTENLLGN